MSLSILIVGAGKVGASLGRRWLEHGHDVRFGVPDPENPKYADLPGERLQRSGERRGAQVVVLALPFTAVKAAIEALGDLRGVTLIDCTNPIAWASGGPALLFGHDTSGAEQIAALAPGASVYKTLNQTGVENLADATAYHPRPVMFVAGDDAEHKPLILELVSEIGFEAIDAGPLIAARLIEPFALLWIELSMTRDHGRDFTFAMVRHPHRTASRQVDR
jgi:predicted dinucleotide-binding enzyme